MNNQTIDTNKIFINNNFNNGLFVKRCRKSFKVKSGERFVSRILKITKGKTSNPNKNRM